MQNGYEKGRQVRQFILEEVRNHPKDIAGFTQKSFQITRQAVYRHIRKLIDNGF